MVDVHNYAPFPVEVRVKIDGKSGSQLLVLFFFRSAISILY
jgi:hypothetical protein